MAKVTSKYQVTVPKKIVDEYSIRPGDDIEWVAAGEAIRVIPSRKPAAPRSHEARLRCYDQATERNRRHRSVPSSERPSNRGWRRGDLYGRGRSR